MSESLPKSKSLSDYRYATSVLTRMIDAWSEVDTKTDDNRNHRYTRDCDSADLRASGIIAPNEIYAPVRVIDTNIRREQPQYVNYVSQSPRSVVFLDAHGQTPQNIIAAGETDFTKRARYIGWEKAFIRTIDGMQTHGWDAVEIVFDDNYPGHFAVEHIGHSDLIFPQDCEDIQSQEVVAIRKRLTSLTLTKFITDFDFDKEAVNNVISTSKKGSQEIEDSIHEVYKVFYKENNCAYVAWYSKEARTWLKEPAKLFLGRRDLTKGKMMLGYTDQGEEIYDFPQLEESSYPIFISAYVESEDPKIIELKGRADLDVSVQEGASAMQSSLVNGCIKASQIMASPAKNNINSNPQAAPKITDVVLKPGGIYDQPLDFWSTPWPEATLIAGLQTLVSQNQNEQNQVNFAVLNRKDSNKTAHEVETANKKSQELGSIQIILLSIFVRSVYSFCWDIYQNRVLQGKIKVDPALMSFFVDEQGSPKEYILRSSGDVDVIEREAKLNRYMTSWAVFQSTPLAMVILEDIVRLMFPDEAERYITVLKQGYASQQSAVINKLRNVIPLLVTDENGQTTPTGQAASQELAQLDAEAQAAIMGGQQMVPGMATAGAA